MRNALLIWLGIAIIFTLSLVVAARRKPVNTRGQHLRTLANANPRFLL